MSFGCSLSRRLHLCMQVCSWSMQTFHPMKWFKHLPVRHLLTNLHPVSASLAC